MNALIPAIFDFLAKAFDSIPILNKIKGYRSALGLVALACLYALDVKHIGGGQLVANYGVYLQTFIGLALNAKQAGP